MQYMYDTNFRYLDLLANNLTISVGHNHDLVVERLRSQLDKTVHTSTMYDSPVLSELTEKLLATFPKRTDGRDWKVLYSVTGTAVVELAITMARVVTGTPGFLSLENSYHGSYGVAMAASGTHKCKHDLPETGHMFHVPMPNQQKTATTYNEVDIAEKIINSSTSGKIAGWIYEPVQGYGGIHLVPDEFVQDMTKLTHRYGGLVIADEIQCGLRRMGSHFWGFEMNGIEPDMVLIGKGLGNGLPISAIVARDDIFDEFSKTGKFIFDTYGGNPLIASGATAVLDTVTTPEFQEYVTDMGAYIQEHFDNFCADVGKDVPWKFSVRGRGLMWGLEIQPPSVAKYIFEEMRQKGILMGLGGRNQNVLRIMPPMCVTKENIDLTFAGLETVIWTKQFSNHL